MRRCYWGAAILAVGLYTCPAMAATTRFYDSCLASNATPRLQIESCTFALAAENLELGRLVVADCVNPVLASRVGWRQTAAQKSACVVEIEVVCSDVILHRRRVETRASDIYGLKLPTWDEVVNRDYEPWDREHLVLDTAVSSLDHLLQQADAYVRAKTG